MLFEIDSVLAPKSHKIWVCLAQQADQLQLSGCSSLARKSLDNLCVRTVNCIFAHSTVLVGIKLSTASVQLRCLYSLKVPKCEIFHLFDFNDFYGITSL
jgi:hypothetical protein